MKKFAILWVLALAGCGNPVNAPTDISSDQAPTTTTVTHHPAWQTENVPANYALKTAPLPNQDTPAQGQRLYSQHCAGCHGEDGMSENLASTEQTPPAPPLAIISSLHSDAYLFWRISEGGLEAGTTMPGWKNSLSEEEIWNTVAYLREMSNRQSPEILAIRASQQAALLQEAVRQGILTETEAHTFQWMRDTIAEYIQNHPNSNAENAIQSLQNEGVFTPQQAQEFLVTQERLRQNGYLQ